jgi:hypothetical protein
MFGLPDWLNPIPTFIGNSASNFVSNPLGGILGNLGTLGNTLGGTAVKPLLGAVPGVFGKSANSAVESLPSLPSIPSPSTPDFTPPPAPPPPPAPSQPQVAQKLETAAASQRGVTGMAANILTSPKGLMSPPSLARRTLMGS